MTLAYIGLGANLGEPHRQLTEALSAMSGLPETRLARHSSFYRTAPVGYANQPEFLNAVAALETRLAPGVLLEGLQGIERRHGRERSFPDAPRTLDLDLLLFGDEQIARQAPADFDTVAGRKTKIAAVVIPDDAIGAPVARAGARGRHADRTLPRGYCSAVGADFRRTAAANERDVPVAGIVAASMG